MKRFIEVLRSGHWPSLLGAWLHFEVSFMVWLLIAALGVAIAEDFSLSATQKGLLVSVPLLGGALLRIPVGLCSDVFGPKVVGLFLLGGELAALFWGWLGAGSFGELLGIGLLLGAAGASFAVALPLASRAYPPASQGLAMGIAASANSGTVLATFFAPRAAHAVGWHGVFGLTAIPVLATALAFALLVRGDGGAGSVERRAGWGNLLREIGRLPSVSWLCFIYAVTFGGFVGFCSFLPLFLHDQYGLGLVLAGSWAALCGLAGSLARTLGGFVADRWGGLAVLKGLFPVLALLAVALASVPGLAWTLPLMVTALACMGFGNGVVFQVVAERLPKQIGMASGVIGAAGGLGGVLISLSFGLLKDRTGGFGAGFFAFGCMSLAALAIVVLMAWRSGRGIAQE